jgi:energy-coupling factor transport system permease protein
MLWAACAGAVAFGTANPFYLLLLVAVCWVVHAANRIEGPASRSFRIFLMLAAGATALRTLLVVFDGVTASRVAYSSLEGLRLGVLLVVFGTFNSVTDPFGVLRLAPRRFHEPALAAALALSIAPRTITAVERVREAQALRGISVRRFRSLPALAVPVLENGMEDAVTLAESMDARGHGRGQRTRYRPVRWSSRASAVAAASAAAAGAFVLAGALGAGGLTPSTDPLIWPEVSIPLVAAVCLLALPGFLSARRGP